MELGIALPQLGPSGDARRIAEFAKTAEQLGYCSLWVGDRMLTPLAPSDPYPGRVQPYPPEHTSLLDPIVVLSVAAAATTTARLGSSTLNAPWYNPVLLGRALTSLDLLSAGRLDVGVGLGWMRDEYEATGLGWAERGARLDEVLDVWQELWSSSLVQYSGRFFEIPESAVDLRPVQPGGPPVLLAGLSPRAMERVGRRAAGWLAIAGLPETVSEPLWDTARRAAEVAGRDPEALRRVTRVNSRPGSTDDEIVFGVLASAPSDTSEVFIDLSYGSGGVDEALERAATVIAQVNAKA